METRILLAGFGGQGILFAGKLFTYIGLTADKEVTNIPEYGPEMRGGTCNCSVIISDEPIGSPLVLEPDILFVMNIPSLVRFESKVAVGGKIFIDSSMIDRKTSRDDVTAYYIPATTLAGENGMDKMANVIMFGKVLRETGICTLEMMEKVLNKCIPASRKALIASNMKALEIGYNYK